MTSFYQDLYNWLQSMPDLVALFGTRMYPDRARSNATFPCLVLTKIGNPKRYTQDGQSSLEQVIYQIACWSTSVQDSSESADVLESAISGYRGIVGNRMAGNVMILNRIDTSDPETGLEGQLFDVRISLQ